MMYTMNISISRRVLSAACLSLMASSALCAAPASFPSRPVRIISPFPPGSGTDIVARAIATPLTAAWHQSVVVDNRAGAGGTIAGDLVAKGTPDGYTLLLGNVSTLSIAPGLYPNL